MSTNRASLAVFRSKTVGLVDVLHLAPVDVVNLTLRLAVEYADKAGLGSDDLRSRLSDLHAVHAVEGDNGGGHGD